MGNGVYAFVLKGAFEVEGRRLGPRDGLGISAIRDTAILSLAEDSEILLMEVPMDGFAS